MAPDTGFRWCEGLFGVSLNDRYLRLFQANDEGCDKPA